MFELYLVSVGFMLGSVLASIAFLMMDDRKDK